MLAPDSKEFADRLLAYEQVFIDAVRATGGNRNLRKKAEKAIINKHSLDLYVERAKKYHAFLPLFSIFATENESLNSKLK